MAEHVSWKKITKNESNYLGEWDLGNSNAVVTIKDAKEEEVRIPARNIVKTALVITFEEFPKKFVCNDTNGKRIQRALGTRFLDEWVGKKIELYVDDKVRFQSELVSAIRVKPTAPTQANLVYRCEICGKEINKDVYDYSMQKFGKAYCGKECLEKDTKGEDLLK